MNRWQFYYQHSLAGYFISRAKEKWFPPEPQTQMDLNGVTLQLDGLPEQMRNVLLSGHYESGEINILPSLITDADQVLEIGSAIGFLGLYCQKILKVKKFIGFEPNPVTLECLRKNYLLNGIAPNIVEAAIAEVDGPITFNTSEMFWADSLLAPPKDQPLKPITVEGLTFASLLRRAGAGYNVLIIDVEGGEQYIPIAEIPASVSKILIEIHPQILGIRKAYSILESLIFSGFRIHGHHHDCWGLVRN